jgi:Na+-driven multidrug efflux pump
MCGAALLRSVGDAQRAMYVTLFGAIAAGILDPIFIFALGLGIEGAAIATVLARFVILWAAFYGVVQVHGLVKRWRVEGFRADATATAGVAIPAILTNVATPVANAYVTFSMAPFGDSAVAAWAIIGRIIPVAFAGVFALTGAIGPILGQNLGAGQHGRVRQAFTDALTFTAIYSAAAWAALAVFHGQLSALFNATPETAELIRFFCLWATPLFAFLGAQFVANAAFNALGRPQFSTVLNWGRASLGTVPFVMAGGALFGAAGVIGGNMVGGVIFGLLSVALCYSYISKIANIDGTNAVAVKQHLRV